MAQGKDDSNLMVIRIAVWIKEFKENFVTSLVSNIGSVGFWQVYTLSEYP